MKKVYLLIILFLCLGGCSNGGIYEFTGTSDNWDILYVVNVTNDDEQEATGTLEYVGDGPTPETVDYEIGTKLTTLGGTGRQLTDGKANIGNDRCEGCSVIQGDEEIEVKIMWDGQTESFILTNNK